MLEQSTLYFASRTMPSGRRFDVLDAQTIEFEAPALAFAVEFALNSLYELRVSFAVDNLDLDLEQLVWRRVALEILSHDQAPVYWHGVAEQLRYVEPRGEGYRYEAIVRPAAHRLIYGQDTRIFQGQTMPSIAGSALAGSGQELEWHLTGDYPVQDYVVQRQETDWAFAKRLLCDEGITFWFTHASDRHVMHLSDDGSAYRALSQPLRMSFVDLEDPWVIGDVSLTTRIVHDAHVTRDWNWRRPDTPVEAESADGGVRRFERYEYPGGFGEASDGARLARRRQEAATCRRTELFGSVSAADLLPACTFTLVDATPDELNGDYVVTATVHTFGSTVDRAEAAHAITLRAAPTSVVYRPGRDVARPHVDGRETALVTGPGGAEIHVDPFGQVKASFYWDRAGATDHHSSTWIRSVQPNTVGSMFLPRVGWEVAVAHIDGDPNRPLVTHKLFNSEHVPTYPLPDAISRTSWSTASSPGGAGSNELRFDDTLGAMQLFVHATRDYHCRVAHDRFETVGVNSSEQTQGRLDASIGRDERVTIGVDETLQIREDLRSNTGGTKTSTIAGLDSWNIRRNQAITVAGDRTTTVVGAMVMVARTVTQTLHGDRDRVIGGALIRRVGGSAVEAIGGSKSETVSGASVRLVRRPHSEQIQGSKTFTAGETTMSTAGSFSASGDNFEVTVSGALAENVVGTAGLGGASVAVRGSDSLRASAGGAELLLSGDVLELDGTAFSSTATRVRLLGQVEVIGARGADDSAPEEPSPEDDWVEITLMDANSQPRADEAYVLRLADGSERSGTLDGSGHAREDGLPPGTVLLSFPDLAETPESEEEEEEEEEQDQEEESAQTDPPPAAGAAEPPPTGSGEPPSGGAGTP